MRASIKSDLLLLREFLAIIVGLFVLTAIPVLSGSGKAIGLYASLSICINTLYPTFLFSMDSTGDWQRILLSAPVSRRSLVGGRYLLLLLLNLIGQLGAFVISVGFAGGAVGLNTCWLLFFLSLGLICSGIVPPLCFWLGSRGVYAIIALYLLPIGIGFGTGFEIFSYQTVQRILALLSLIPVELGICAVSLILFFLSYLLSCAIYQRKDL